MLAFLMRDKSMNSIKQINKLRQVATFYEDLGSIYENSKVEKDGVFYF